MRIWRSVPSVFGAAAIFLFWTVPVYACTIEYVVRLKTFGENVGVELRSGIVGSSSVVRSTRSSGGVVSFTGLCSGQYFLAIGDGDRVSVTEPNLFNEGYGYESEIVMQTGSGNVKTLGRGDL